MAQERNYETKHTKMTGGSERTFAQKEAFEKEGAAGKPYNGEKGQGRKPPNKVKKISCSVSLSNRLRQ